MLSNTMKDVTEATALNDDPTIAPAVTELNEYLSTIKSSVDENSLVTSLSNTTVETAPKNSTCIDPIVLQSVQNIGEAQQLVSNILSNVSSTISAVSTNFNSLANNNDESNGTVSTDVNSVFSAVSSILQTVLNFTNFQIQLVNNRIETGFNKFSQLALNMSTCQPSNSSETISITFEEITPVTKETTESAIVSTEESEPVDDTTVGDEVKINVIDVVEV